MSRRGTVAAAVAGVVVAVALVVAATGPSVPVLSRPVSTVTFTEVPTTTVQPTSSPVSPVTSFRDVAPSPPSPLWGLLVQVVIALVAIGVLAVLAQIVIALLRRPRLVRHDEPVFEAPDVPEELLAGARAGIDLLLTGEPRNAIVAAWLALETSAAATGLPRDPAETSTEYTARVIGTWAIDRDRLADLAALYREARFSVHDLGEIHRDRAVADLRVLSADLERVAAAVPGPAPERADDAR
ncbi:DUF4129 domain-containing protein [Intrasporangium flavum]|uniref:DUF4129 domain-containing protein n=1 Tax=Intrasporangium flavum TaxID=1428657 RepID=UPI00096D1294|nr:DUF4129 domain-containing protein [Intrasporangium flavum]